MSGFLGVLQLKSSLVVQKGSVKSDEFPRLLTPLDSEDDQFYLDKLIKIGFPDLSMNHLEHDRHPFISECHRYVLVFDGEIYNTVELREQLRERGYVFNTNSEQELILNLFLENGEETFIKLRGMFAIVIWDQERQVFYAARDQFGIKSLFFHQADDKLIFASRRDLLNHEEQIEINSQALQHYFSFQYVPEPATLDQQVQKLEPGHLLIHHQNDQLKFKRYWQVSFAPIRDEHSWWIRRIQDQLMESVCLRLKSEEPVGAFLSGGIDSSFIVALAKEIDPSIKTFSVGFDQDGFSEIDIAKQTAAQLGLENYSKIITPDEYMNSLPRIIQHLGDPLADPSCVPLYFVAQEASKHVSVVLSGEGADELFGGYNIYREPRALKVFEYMPSKLRRILNQLAQVMPEGMKGRSYLERGTMPLKERYIGNAKIFENGELDHLLCDYDPNVNYQQITLPYYQKVADLHAVEQMQYIDLHTWLRGNILLKAERMLNAHSLGLRVPFLDQKVFDLAMGIPVHLKIAKGTTKYILREAAKGIVPDHVINRKKLGFPVPIRHWLKNEMYQWAKSIIICSETDHLINKSYVLELLEIHAHGKRDYSRKIWAVLVFMIWHQIFIETNQSDEQFTDKSKIS